MNNHNIAVILSSNATTFRGQMAVASSAVNDFKRSGNSAAAASSKWGRVIKTGVAAVVLTLAASLAYGVTRFIEFEAAMRNVNSISKLSEEQFAKQSKQVIDLSTTLPQSATVLAEGLYEIASSGFQGAEGLHVLEVSAKAASAGLTETQVASKGIVAVLNAYGRSAGAATDVSDVLFKTVDVGVISFEELSSNLGDVVGTAAAANVEIGEVGAAIAAMTLAGINGAESTTALNRLVQALIKPSEALAEQMNALGYESGKAALDALGLHGTMELLREATGGNVEVLLELFPEIRAAKGAFALMAADGKNYARTFAGVADETQRAGATQKALAEQSKSVSFQLKIFRNRFEAAAITVGQKFGPAIAGGLQTLLRWASATNKFAQDLGRRLTPALEDIVSAGRSAAAIIVGLAEAFTPLAKLIAGLALGAVIIAFRGFGAALDWVTDVAEDNLDVLKLIVVLLATRWLTTLPSVIGQMKLFTAGMAAISRLRTASIIQEVGLRLLYLKDALRQTVATGQWGAVRSLRDAFSGLGTGIVNMVKRAVTSPTVGLAALAIGVYTVHDAFVKADRKAQEFARGLTEDIDVTSMTDLDAGITKVAEELEKAQSHLSGFQDWGGVLGEVVNVLTPLENEGLDAAAAVEALQSELDRLSQIRFNFDYAIENIQRLGDVDWPTERIIAFADALDVDLSSDKFAGGGEALLDLIGKMRILDTEARTATPTQIEVADALEEVADGASNAEDRVSALSDAYDAIIGQSVSVFDATSRMEEAFDELATSLKENGRTLDANTEKGRANRDVFSGLIQNAVDLAVAVGEETGSVTRANDTLLTQKNRLGEVMRQAGYTEEEIKSLNTEFGLTPENITTLLALAGVDTAKNELANHQERLDAITPKKVTDVDVNLAEAERKLLWFTGRKWSTTVRVNAQLIDPYVTMPGLQVGGGAFGRWGMITQYQRGGIHAHVARGDVIRYAEPATGGEAFIPRRGNPLRSLAVLEAAAAWYGMRVVPMQNGGVIVPTGRTSRPAANDSSGNTYIEVKIIRPDLTLSEALQQGWDTAAWKLKTRSDR